MNYILVFVVTFHPQFVTKIDRAYNVRCFYAQQEKTVSSSLEVRYSYVLCCCQFYLGRIAIRFALYLKIKYEYVFHYLFYSMLSTQSLEIGIIIMPNCLYTVRSNTLNGPPVKFVRIGDRLVHRWECDNRKTWILFYLFLKIIILLCMTQFHRLSIICHAIGRALLNYASFLGLTSCQKFIYFQLILEC